MIKLIFVLLNAFLMVTTMAKEVTIREYSGHGCEGEPRSTSTYEISMGCTSGNLVPSFQSTCDIYTFKLSYEFFFGTTECVKQCDSSLCYSKTEMYSGYCEDFTTEIMGVETYSSQYASFDCYSESWFFYALVTMGFLLCCCVPCCCGYYCRGRKG